MLFSKVLYTLFLSTPALSQLQPPPPVAIPNQAPLNFGSNETASSTCHDACTALTETLGAKNVYYGLIPPDITSGYHTAQQRSIVPLCHVLPTSAIDVSAAIRIIGKHECVFAIKSGGHAMWAGASSAHEGITLDLRNLTTLKISEDGETVAVGTGNRWFNVFEFLDPFNRTVVGGRSGDVGVGGFLLGGGISYISRHHGWGLDNVRNFEVVLPNGTITTASSTYHPDLYWALRGGGNNFGVVTRFDLELHSELTSMWGGFTVALLSDISPKLTTFSIPRSFSFHPMSLLQQFSNWIIPTIGCRLGYCTTTDYVAEYMESLPDKLADDKDISFYPVLTFTPYVHVYIMCMSMTHARGISDPPALAEITGRKFAYSTLRQGKHVDFPAEILDMNKPVKGMRLNFQGVTFKVSAPLTKEIMRIFIEEVEAIRSKVKMFTSSIPMQLITRDEIEIMQKNGGNALGIKVEDAPLLHINIATGWSLASDDAAVYAYSNRIIERCVAKAREMGLDHRFIYQNYATKGQDVFAGYGEENQERLRGIKKAVDPEGVWERLLVGGFKV